MTKINNILEIKHLTKRFPGVTALDDVSLNIRRGETHILLGENGAGKSSLIKVISGVYAAEEGEIFYNRARYSPTRPHDAIEAGIQVIHQELNLLTYLTVAENILFEKLPSRFGVVDQRKLTEQAQALLDEVGLEVSPGTPVEQLGVAQMQLVEIAKALSADSQVLIMDEPTATLTSQEIERLFAIIHQLKAKGVTIIYISHRLQEVFEIGDRFTVLRNGQVVGTQPLDGTKISDIVKMMVGRDLANEYLFREDVARGAEMFRVEDLQVADGSSKVSFSVKGGEILGIAGLVGSGRTELLRAIFGADAKAGGRLFLRNQPIDVRRPKDAVRQGISFLTEDRKEQGLILDMSCYANITVTNLSAISQVGLLQAAEEQQASNRLIDSLGIKTPSSSQLVRNLSGGNQQKIVLAKWLFRNTNLLMIDEPTRGIDVGAKYEIYSLLWELAAQGKAIIIVSSDLPEIMGICHRVIVFSKGKISGEVDRADFDQEQILSLAYQEYIQE
ncbi:MAG: sugar ABC transporter ATP-binding protein [Ardenticatenaceae bacterium]|nr:sugar ABC transporter ATP-binding protein [Ardenticatenaceae bacterium]